MRRRVRADHAAPVAVPPELVGVRPVEEWVEPGREPAPLPGPLSERDEERRQCLGDTPELYAWRLLAERRLAAARSRFRLDHSGRPLAIAGLDEGGVILELRRWLMGSACVFTDADAFTRKAARP